jgi:membrane protein YdbS with pleckstrin-like domain
MRKAKYSVLTSVFICLYICVWHYGSIHIEWRLWRFIYASEVQHTGMRHTLF